MNIHYFCYWKSIELIEVNAIPLKCCEFRWSPVSFSELRFCRVWDGPRAPSSRWILSKIMTNHTFYMCCCLWNWPQAHSSRRKSSKHAKHLWNSYFLLCCCLSFGRRHLFPSEYYEKTIKMLDIIRNHSKHNKIIKFPEMSVRFKN